ncbi:MAG: CoA-acylating methylmalonate-semialdehyde dehydrogenase [Acidobacteriota bacterium]
MESATLRNYIDGQWVASSSGETLDTHDPLTGKPVAKVPLSTPNEVHAAVAAAKAAFQEWRETPVLTRAQHMFRLKEVMETRFEELAGTISKEHGKTIDEARGEVRRTIENVEVAAGAPRMMMGYNTEDVAAGIDEEVVLQPVGVFCAVTPFNFPAMVPFMFLPYAVACGNTYIVKPSEICPAGTAMLFDIMEEADFPPGVVNMIHGAGETVDALLTHPDVAGVSFVGSTPVGKHIYSTAAAHGKRAQSQMGAKNCLVMMPDAPVDRTVPAILSSVFGNAGQRCLAGSLVLAVGDVYEPLKARLVEAAARIKVGGGLDEAVQMGPVVTHRAQERILGYIEKGIEEGAELILDGRQVAVEEHPDGCFIGPTIFDKVRPEMVIAREEIFGPVMGILHVADFEEALAIIESIPYGNAASLFTSNGKWAREFKYRVRAGNIGVNIGVPAPLSTYPLCGLKESFHGDLHGQGLDAFQFFTDRKVVITRWS